MLILKLAFRNLFRNTRRSVLTIMLIGFSLTALILTDAITRGMLTLMVNNVTQTLTGEAQVHHAGYREDLDVDLYLTDTKRIEKELRQDPAIEAYASRVISGGMISSSYNVSAGLFYGINAEAELNISKTREALIEGEYLSGKNTEILIGHSMAELLEVELGDRIVFTLSEANTGELTQALFRISGILEFGVRQLDDGVAFINIEAARKVLGLNEDQSHEIAIRFKNPKDAENPSLPIFKQLNDESTEMLGWLDLNKEIGVIVEMTAYSSVIVGLVLFLLASLGVINSMFMSIYERIYEFGVIKAIGSRPSALSRLILCEALLLAVISCLFGMLLAFAVGSWTGVHGVPIGEIEFSGIAISNNILTELDKTQFINFPIFVTLLTVVAALYPARFAARIIPTEALHRSL